MKTLYSLAVGVVITLVLILAVLWMQDCHHPSHPNPLGAGVQLRIDSVLVTQPTFADSQQAEHHLIDSLRVVLAHQRPKIVQDSIYVQADSDLLRQSDNVRDSLTAALTLVESTAAENHDLHEQITLLAQDTLHLRNLYVRDSTRLAAVTQLNRDVAQAVQHLGECRVLFVPCPTRTEAFVLGAITTGAGVVALAQHIH